MRSVCAVHPSFDAPAHKGIRRLFLGGDPGEDPAAAVDKLRKMPAFLQDVETADELYAVFLWKAHRLTGDRKGAWSLHVTRNCGLPSAGGDEITNANSRGLPLIGRTIVRMPSPPHPGAFVKTEVIEPLGLTVAAAAQPCSVSRALRFRRFSIAVPICPARWRYVSRRRSAFG